MATRRRKKAATKKATKAPAPANDEAREPEQSEEEGEADPAPDAAGEGGEDGASAQDAPDASSKDDSTGDPDPDATQKVQTHRSTQGGQLIRPFPNEYYNQIRDEAQRRREKNGGPPRHTSRERGPEGRFGIIGGDVVCANLSCERRRLLDGMVVWVFTADHQTPKRHYDNGTTLCLGCAKDVHKGMARRADLTMKGLVERYGDKEARRITTGQVHHGHGQALSRMST